MPRRDVAAVVLAAGKGTRFKSDTAKLLHRAAGRTLLRHTLEALRPLGLGQVVVVVGHQAYEVAAEAAAAGVPELATVVQRQQLGSGDAARTALSAIRGGIGRVLVLNGDHPLLTPDHLAPLLDGEDPAAASILTCELEDPTGFGRVLRDDNGAVSRVVEERDADDGQRAVREVNVGMYRFDLDQLRNALDRLGTDNDQGELYLPDVVATLVGDGHTVAATRTDADAAAGVNDRAQLAAAATRLRQRHLERLMRDGVTVVDPAATYLDVDVKVGVDTVILPGTILDAGTRVGARARIGPNSHLTAAVVEDGAEVANSVAIEAWIGPDATVGPFSYLRPGARLERGAKTGAFVEVKGSTIGPGAKVPHLSYVGDADLGRDVNFSAGAITVNYDGFDKHRTVVEDGAFVGCDTMLVAPVTIGTGAYVAAGSAITDDVPADALAIARQRQVVKDGWARRWRADHMSDGDDGGPASPQDD